MKAGGAFLLGLLAAVLASCGGQVMPGAAHHDCNVKNPHECCGSTMSHGLLCGYDFGPATCGPKGWTCSSGVDPSFGCSGLCIGDPSLDGGDAETDATVDAADARSEPVRYDVCGYPFAVDPEAGADAGAYTLTSEDVACTTAADCLILRCRSCCSAVEVGVNKASTYDCAPVECPAPPPNAPPMGCPPEALFAQDCQEVFGGVGIACINHQCLTSASPSDADGPTTDAPDATTPSDASDAKE